MIVIMRIIWIQIWISIHYDYRLNQDLSIHLWLLSSKCHVFYDKIYNDDTLSIRLIWGLLRRPWRQNGLEQLLALIRLLLLDFLDNESNKYASGNVWFSRSGFGDFWFQDFGFGGDFWFPEQRFAIAFLAFVVISPKRLQSVSWQDNRGRSWANIFPKKLMC